MRENETVLHAPNFRIKDASKPESEGKSIRPIETVVICWVRNALINLIEGLGVTQGPSDWPEDLFDRALILNFSGRAHS